MTVRAWSRRVPPAAWLLAAVLLLNLATTTLWPALAALGCEPHAVPTTTAHPDGTVEEGPHTPPCESSFRQVLRDRGRSWPVEAFLFPLVGGHLLSPGGYDSDAFLGWTVWVLAVASPVLTGYLTRHAPPRAWAWRVPLAYVVAALTSGAWIQEWEHFD